MLAMTRALCLTDTGSGHCFEMNRENGREQRDSQEGESMRELLTIKGRTIVPPWLPLCTARVINNDAKSTWLKWTWMAGRDEINEPESVKLL